MKPTLPFDANVLALGLLEAANVLTMEQAALVGSRLRSKLVSLPDADTKTVAEVLALIDSVVDRASDTVRRCCWPAVSTIRSARRGKARRVLRRL